MQTIDIFLPDGCFDASATAKIRRATDRVRLSNWYASRYTCPGCHRAADSCVCLECVESQNFLPDLFDAIDANRSARFYLDTREIFDLRECWPTRTSSINYRRRSGGSHAEPNPSPHTTRVIESTPVRLNVCLGLQVTNVGDLMAGADSLLSLEGLCRSVYLAWDSQDDINMAGYGERFSDVFLLLQPNAGIEARAEEQRLDVVKCFEPVNG